MKKGWKPVWKTAILLRELQSLDQTRAQAAKLLGFHGPSRVSQIGIGGKWRSPNPSRWERAIEMLKSGMKTRVVAKELGFANRASFVIGLWQRGFSALELRHGGRWEIPPDKKALWIKMRQAKVPHAEAAKALGLKRIERDGAPPGA